MTRVDRVLDLLEYLRAQETTTVGQIARALEVSSRTVLRDLAVLRERGWPISSDTGPGGGVRLERERGVAAVHLAVEEIVALWLSAQLSATMRALPWSSSARSALDKLFASIPRERARVLRQLVKRIVVGKPATPRILAELGNAPPELLVELERAIAQDLCLQLDYVDRHGKKTRRLIEPHGLLVEAPAWYVLSRDAESGAARMFRMDRVRRPRVRADRSFVPDFEGVKAQALEQRQAQVSLMTTRSLPGPPSPEVRRSQMLRKPPST